MLLEGIRDTGSISAAARRMAMSYRRAWLLVADLNRIFRQPVIATATGGRNGGGAELTGFGADLVSRYRAMERDIHAVLASHLDALQAETSGLGAACSEDPICMPCAVPGLEVLTTAPDRPEASRPAPLSPETTPQTSDCAAQTPRS